MKKLIIIFSIFLSILFSMNTIDVMAQPQTFSQGIYKITDLKLTQNVAYNVKNISPVETVVIIFDGSKKILQTIRLEGNSINYLIRPMQFDYGIVMYGDGQLVFTPTTIIP